MEMDPRPIGIVLVLLGAIGVAISALADPLGIGEGEVFGWLQITGVIVSSVVTLLGVAIATEWVPLPGRRSAVAGGSQTNIIHESKSDERSV
jgi:hypothetical protein